MAGLRNLLSRSFKALSASTVLWCAAGEVAASERVHLELVLAVDCSSSVNRDEFVLQMEGIAAAFEDPEVLAALEQVGEQGVAVSLLQWSSAGAQAKTIPWTRISTQTEALAFSAQVRSAGRQILGGATALGNAIDMATRWIQGNAYLGERMVIDVSGDGRSNEGGSPAYARAVANRAGITINGLAILNEEPELARYYVAGVVGGPGAFLLSADDFDDFATAMRRKLYFEIAGPPVADAPQAKPARAPLVTQLWQEK